MSATPTSQDQAKQITTIVNALTKLSSDDRGIWFAKYRDDQNFKTILIQAAKEDVAISEEILKNPDCLSILSLDEQNHIKRLSATENHQEALDILDDILTEHDSGSSRDSIPQEVESYQTALEKLRSEGPILSKDNISDLIQKYTHNTNFAQGLMPVLRTLPQGVTGAGSLLDNEKIARNFLSSPRLYKELNAVEKNTVLNLLVETLADPSTSPEQRASWFQHFHAEHAIQHNDAATFITIIKDAAMTDAKLAFYILEDITCKNNLPSTTKKEILKHYDVDHSEALFNKIIDPQPLPSIDKAILDKAAKYYYENYIKEAGTTNLTYRLYAVPSAKTSSEDNAGYELTYEFANREAVVGAKLYIADLLEYARLQDESAKTTHDGLTSLSATKSGIEDLDDLLGELNNSKIHSPEASTTTQSTALNIKDKNSIKAAFKQLDLQIQSLPDGDDTPQFLNHVSQLKLSIAAQYTKLSLTERQAWLDRLEERVNTRAINLPRDQKAELLEKFQQIKALINTPIALLSDADQAAKKKEFNDLISGLKEIFATPTSAARLTDHQRENATAKLIILQKQIDSYLELMPTVNAKNIVDKQLKSQKLAVLTSELQTKITQLSAAPADANVEKMRADDMSDLFVQIKDLITTENFLEIIRPLITNSINTAIENLQNEISPTTQVFDPLTEVTKKLALAFDIKNTFSVSESAELNDKIAQVSQWQAALNKPQPSVPTSLVQTQNSVAIRENIATLQAQLQKALTQGPELDALQRKITQQTVLLEKISHREQVQCEKNLEKLTKEFLLTKPLQYKSTVKSIIDYLKDLPDEKTGNKEIGRLTKNLENKLNQAKQALAPRSLSEKMQDISEDVTGEAKKFIDLHFRNILTEKQQLREALPGLIADVLLLPTYPAETPSKNVDASIVGTGKIMSDENIMVRLVADKYTLRLKKLGSLAGHNDPKHFAKELQTLTKDLLNVRDKYPWVEEKLIAVKELLTNSQTELATRSVAKKLEDFSNKPIEVVSTFKKFAKRVITGEKTDKQQARETLKETGKIIEKAQPPVMKKSH